MGLRRFYCFLLLLLCFGTAAAQKNRAFKAVVMNAREGVAINDATVALYLANDSLPYDFTTTDAKGHFQFRKVDTGQYVLLVTAAGFKSLRLSFSVMSKSVNLPDTLSLAVVVKEEDMVTVKGIVNPVTVKKDTIEFNPAAYRTPLEDAVEELLKKLPGFSLDKDGSLLYNGEEIKQIMVDGKPFSLDPNLPITKILPLSAIEKIQLIDQRLPENKFNKNDNGERQKVLNLVVKKDKKFGWLGKAAAAAGSNRLKSGSASLNRFRNERKIFSSFQGSNAGAGGNIAPQPLATRTRNLSFGAGYQNNWKKVGNLSLNAGVSDNTSEQQNNSVRTTFLPGDSSFTVTNQGRNEATSQGRNLGFYYSKDKENRSNLSFDGSLGASKGTSFRESGSAMKNHLQQPLNNLQSRSNGNLHAEQFNLNLNYNRQLDTLGRSLSIRLGYQQGQNAQTQFNTAENVFYETNGSVKRTDSLNQKRETTGSSINRQLNLNYNMPVFGKLDLSFSYALQLSDNRSGIDVYDYDKITRQYRLFNDSLSNGFSSRNLGNTGTVTLGKSRNGIHYSFRLGFRNQYNRNKNFDSLQTQIQRFLNFTPGFTFNSFRKNRPSIRFNYNGSTNQPTLVQRQPVIDNTNPLYLRLGNPALKPEYSNQFSLNVAQNITRSQINYNVTLSFNNTFNKITESIAYTSEGKQVSQPVNISGAFNSSMWSSFGFPISKKKRHYGGISFSGQRSRYISLQNAQRTEGNNLSLSTGLNFNTGVPEWLEINGGINYSYSESRYNTATRSNIFFNTFSTNLRVLVRLPGQLEFQSQTDYLNRGKQVQFGRESLIWNLALNKKLLNKTLIAGFRINDLLQQSITYNRNTGTNYIEESSTNIIRRYFLFTLNYQLNKFGGRKKAG